MGAGVGQVGAGDDDLDGGRRAEAHHLADHVSRLEPEGHLLGLRSGRLLGQPLLLEQVRQPGFDFRWAAPRAAARGTAQANAGALAEGDPHLPVVRAAHEKNQVVHRVERGLLAGEAHGDLHVLGAGLLLYHLERLAQTWRVIS